MNLVLPTPQTVAAADLPALCRRVESLALETVDVNELSDISARWAAIAEYVKRTSTEGIARVEATKRRLEMRIGELSPPTTGNRYTSRDTGAGISTTTPSPNRLVEARQMADHPDIVEQVIAESTDDEPPTKAKVLAAIRADLRSDIEADLRAKAIKAVKRYPELGDPDSTFVTDFDLASGAETLDAEPWRLENLRLHIAARRRQREPGYEPPQLKEWPVDRICPECGHVDRHNCKGTQP